MIGGVARIHASLRPEFLTNIISAYSLFKQTLFITLSYIDKCVTIKALNIIAYVVFSLFWTYESSFSEAVASFLLRNQETLISIRSYKFFLIKLTPLLRFTIYFTSPRYLFFQSLINY